MPCFKCQRWDGVFSICWKGPWPIKGLLTRKISPEHKAKHFHPIKLPDLRIVRVYEWMYDIFSATLSFSLVLTQSRNQCSVGFFSPLICLLALRLCGEVLQPRDASKCSRNLLTNCLPLSVNGKSDTHFNINRCRTTCIWHALCLSTKWTLLLLAWSSRPSQPLCIGSARIFLGTGQECSLRWTWVSRSAGPGSKGLFAPYLLGCVRICIHSSLSYIHLWPCGGSTLGVPWCFSWCALLGVHPVEGNNMRINGTFVATVDDILYQSIDWYNTA